MTENDKVPVGYVVWVFHPDANANAVIVKKDGCPLEYSGQSRKLALEHVLGRTATEQEVIKWTQMLCPAVYDFNEDENYGKRLESLVARMNNHACDYEDEVKLISREGKHFVIGYRCDRRSSDSELQEYEWRFDSLDKVSLKRELNLNSPVPLLAATTVGSPLTGIVWWQMDAVPALMFAAMAAG